MTLPNIQGYAGNDIEDIINMFSITDLNKAEFRDTILRLLAVGKTMEAIMSTNHLGSQYKCHHRGTTLRRRTRRQHILSPTP